MESAKDAEPEPDLDNTLSLEETFESLKRNAHAVDVYLQESRAKLKGLQKKLAQESHELTDIPLQPRTRLMKWLTDRGLAVSSTFREFFEAFLEEHGKELRVDLSDRTVHLNPSACVLFGVNPNTVMNIFDLLTQTEALYC